MNYCHIHVFIHKDIDHAKICELQELQDVIENKIRENLRQELGQIIESSITTALEKALPQVITQAGTANTGMNSSQGKTCRPRKAKKLPEPRSSAHNEFKVNELSACDLLGSLTTSHLEVHLEVRAEALEPRRF